MIDPKSIRNVKSLQMVTENKNNYYEILDIGPNATQHEILVAYQKAKFTYSFSNSDILSVFSEQELSEFRRLIEEAYMVLKNQDYRTIYEKRLLKNSDDPELMSYQSIKSANTDYQAVTIVEHVKSRNEDLSATGSNIEVKPEIDEQFEAEIENQTEWSGDFLKKVREYKKVSIDSLQAKTKINPWYIKAIEAMDSKNLPALVFVRGYVMQLAKELGLNEKSVADSFMKTYKSRLENKS